MRFVLQTLPAKALCQSLAGLGMLLAASGLSAAVAPPATTATLPLGFELRTLEFPTPAITRMEQHPVNRDLYVVGLFTPLFRVDLQGEDLTTQTVVDLRELGLPFVSYASGIDFDTTGNAYILSQAGQILKGNYDAESDSFTTWTMQRDLQPLTPVTGEHGYGGLAIDRTRSLIFVNYGAVNPGNNPSDPEPDYGYNASILCLNLADNEVIVYSRGIRNHFGLTVRSDGQVFGLENSTTCDSAEEFNKLSLGKHYGHPFRFATDRSGSDAGLYPECEETTDPLNRTYTPAWGNLGPDGIPGPGEPGYVDGGIYYGFHPHSTPTGIDFYEPAEMDTDATLFPPDYRGRAFSTRFGTMRPDGSKAGFDVMALHLVEQDQHFHSNAFLTDLNNPMDVVCAKNGRLYVLEFGQGEGGPGRLLEVAYKITPLPTSYLAKQQKLSVESAGSGYQELFYRYSTGSAWITPYMAGSASIPFFPFQNEFLGIYHFDYEAGQYSEALYHKLDWLP